MIKKHLKHLLKILLSIIAPLTWRFGNDKLLIIMYHRVLPPNASGIENEQAGMIVYPDTFQMHLEILEKHFKIVHLDKWLDDYMTGNPIPKNACAITFDDGWRDNYEYAFPILKSKNIPATIFLVSDLLDTHQIFWPERLSFLLQYLVNASDSIFFSTELEWLRDISGDLFSRKLLSKPDIKDKIIGKMKSYSDIVIYEELNKLDAYLKISYKEPLPPILNCSQVKEMNSSGLVNFGSHTRNHIRLNSELTQTTITSEIVDSRKIIKDKTGCTANIFCYPNGDYTAETLQLVKGHYIAACSTVKGWNAGNINPYLLKRIGVHEDISNSKTSFLARISGWI